MGRAIDWTLTELSGDVHMLSRAMDHWFAYRYPQDYPELRENEKNHFRQHYQDGVRYHQGQIQTFRQADRQRIRMGKKPYQARVARRLFAVRRSIIEFCRKQHNRDFGQLGTFDLWRLRNCPPIGGRWKGDIYYGPSNPTGKACRSLLCPWCWYRRFEALKALVTQPESTHVPFPNGLTKPGLGFGPTVNLTTITVDLKGDFSPRRLKLFKDQCNKLLRRKVGKQTEFVKGLKLFGPEVVQKRVSGLICGYIHVDKSPFEPVETFDSAGITIRRYADLNAEEALRIAQPYPVDLLNDATLAKIITTAFAGQDAYGTLWLRYDLKPAPAYEAPDSALVDLCAV